MVKEVRRLYRDSTLAEIKLMVMGGHREGIVSFGKSFHEAFDVLLNFMHGT